MDETYVYIVYLPASDVRKLVGRLGSISSVLTTMWALSSLSSCCNSCSLVLACFTTMLTLARLFLSVVTFFMFSAPSLILSSLRMSFLIWSLICSSLDWKLASERSRESPPKRCPKPAKPEMGVTGSFCRREKMTIFRVLVNNLFKNGRFIKTTNLLI